MPQLAGLIALKKSAIAASNQLSTLPEIYSRLVGSLELLSDSQREQEERHTRLVKVLDDLEPRIQTMVDFMLTGAAKVGQSLDEADNRLQSLGTFSNKLISFAMLALSLALWMGRDMGRYILGTVGICGMSPTVF